MEKIVNDYSIELIIWQIFLVILLLIIVYFLVKLYKKFNNFLDRDK
jgi:F0F1-type ATP synthase membrane subunit b/b'